jgi:predicted HicB family RNase H-like nuclease
MYKAQDYRYSVFYSSEDEGYVGVVSEFPGLSCIEDDYLSALSGIIEVVRLALEILQEEGRDAPAPLSARTYSGKLVLRIPPEKHRELALQAVEQNVSLNRLIASRL